MTGADGPHAPAAVPAGTGLTKTYRHSFRPGRRPAPVLRGADLEPTAGEVVGLVGEGSSGQSTLMQLLRDSSRASSP
ncbi:hypothetical protein ACIGFK_15945 [Streptomyces sp. NPDC085524]|uniref:hypothetical protein n=1 Tax=unclassified Streptomyces TaxID=2593676 RepID=UPI0035E36210